MSILLLTEVFPPQKGGSGRWLWELYRRLSTPVAVVTADVPQGAQFDASTHLPISRVPLIFPTWGLFTLAGVRAYWHTLRLVASIARRIRPVAIHCGKALPEGLIALVCSRVQRRPYVCFVHGEELRLAHTSRDLTWSTRLVLRHASMIVANSAHTRAVLQREWRIVDRVVVMHPGVDTSRFVPADPDESVRARLGWTGHRVVLTVGALQQRKGQDMLIRALPAIRAACPDVLYVIAGEGWERQRLEALVDEHGVRDIVRFMGVPGDDELIACYQQCDLFALPNRQVGWDIEGFGIVLLEAQACGRAVLAGTSGGTAETLRAGVTGELISCDTPDPIARAVIGLLDDGERRRVMGEAGRAWVTAHFDWTVLARQADEAFAPLGR